MPGAGIGALGDLSLGVGLALSTAPVRVGTAAGRRGLLTRRRVLAVRWTLALTVVIAAAAVLRLHDLGARSLWVDELFSVGLAAQDPRTIVTVLYGEEANMTLYYLIMFAWLRVVGGDASEVWMRLPSMLFGLASLWALYELGAELDRPLTGLIAALLAGANAYHVGMSQEARAYTLWALLATLSWLWLVRSLDRGGHRAWLLYTLTTALAFWAHFFTVFLVLAQGLVVLIRMRRAELRSLVLSGLGVGALCLPFVPFFLLNSDGSQILHVRRSDLSDLRELFWLFGGASTQVLWAYTAFGGLGVAVACLDAIRGRNRARFARAFIPLFWLLVPILTIFLLSYVKPMFKERYLFAAMPAFPLLAAIGIGALKPALLGHVAALAIVALATRPVMADFDVRQDENWRSAVSYLTANAQDDDGWIFISKRGQLGYEYYAGWLGDGTGGRARPAVLEGLDWYELANSAGYYRALSSGTSRLPEFTQQHSRIWLVLSHEFDSTFDGDTSEAVRDWLTRNGYGAKQRSFQNVRVLLYERRG